MKARQVIFIILAILFVDQAIKLYIKTHYYLGEEHLVLGNWFRLHFVENPGMAWGARLGAGESAKPILSLFRLVAVIFGVFYIKKIIKQKLHPGFIVCVALIYAGAMGNLLDSMFYGLIFDKGMLYNLVTHDYDPYQGLAAFSSHGYTSFLYGNVVDMLYFPMIKSHYPSWFPFVGGKEFEFFEPVFNIADAAISAGVIAILVFQNKFFKKEHPQPQPATE
ncbi:lipoprotein signal peptidase [Chitinophagaceae bacterium LWZ2-11]